MIKEALQYIVGMSPVKLEQIGTGLYADKQLQRVNEPVSSVFELSTLKSLVEYLKSGVDQSVIADRLVVLVASPTRVEVFSQLNKDKKRNDLVVTKARVPQFRFDSYYDQENMIIALQSKFIRSHDLPAVQLAVSSIVEGEEVKAVDDGTKQEVTIRHGVRTLGQAELPNPVTLQPYRTFVEVEQPVSPFVFRAQKGARTALYEADGGKWELEAVNNIKTYLEGELADAIADGTLVVIA